MKERLVLRGGCCCSDGVPYIEISGQQVRMVGLKEAIQEVYLESAGQSEFALKNALFQAVKKRNRIPLSRVEAYRNALWREYTRFQTEADEMVTTGTRPHPRSVK